LYFTTWKRQKRYLKSHFGKDSFGQILAKKCISLEWNPAAEEKWENKTEEEVQEGGCSSLTVRKVVWGR
jgi:hypothetical protein